MKTVKRLLASLMVAVIMITAAPLSGFLGLDLDSFSAKAASSSSSKETYWVMSHEEAVSFIGFLYDKSASKVEKECIPSDIYTFLTGGYSRGSLEETKAKLVFLETAKSNISQCITSYNEMMNDAYNFLLEELTNKISFGEIVKDTAVDSIDEIIDGIIEIIKEWNVDSAEVRAAVNCLDAVKTGYDVTMDLNDIIEALSYGLSGFRYMWGSSKSNMYTYVSSYISNRNWKSSNNEVFEFLNEYNKFACTQNGLYDPILDWASDDHIAVLESFGDYIYYVMMSFNGNEESTGDDVYDSSSVKVVDVQCPTDVYVYDSQDVLLLSIENNIVRKYSELIFASVYDNKKRIALPGSLEYKIKVVGTDEGTMDYKVTEIEDNSIMRTVEYSSVPLVPGCEYNASIPQEIYTQTQNYNLFSDTGEEIEHSFDSASSGEDIFDVIIAEEMFEGFSTTLIKNVADALFGFSSSVNISEYQLKNEEDITALFAAIQKYYPAEYTALLNSTDFSFRVIISPSLKIVTNIRFYYGEDVNLEAFERRAKDLNEEINSIVDKVEGLDDFEKALYIHDYIVLHCEYDLELADYMNQNGGIIVGSEYYNEKYTDYSVLVNGTGVCDSYATAYRALMNASGVECVHVSSSSMKHAWNEVYLDGQWYHVDCTWDDPVPNNYGTASRKYFLLTDQEMKELNHHSWNPSNYVASDSTYSEMPRKVDRVQKYDYANDLWYYYEDGEIFSSDKYGKNIEEICSVSARTIALDNGKLYYSYGRSVYFYDTETDSSELVFVLPSSKSGTVLGKAYLKNMYVEEKSISYYKVIYDENDSLITVYGESFFNGEDYVSVNKMGVCGENATWKIINNTDLFIDGEGKITDPAWNAFANNVTNITVSDGVTFIPEGAFSGMNSLKSISLPFVGSDRDANNTYDAVLGYVFGKSSNESDIVQYYILENDSLSGNKYAIPKTLESVTITDAIQIPFGAFYNCSMLKEITINDGITQINQMAFWECSGIKYFVVPDSVQTIGQSAFENADSIESIVVPFVGYSRTSNESFEAPLGFIFGGSNSGTIQYTKLNGNSISYYYYNIPSSLKSVTVTDADIIPFGAFCNCEGIKEISINDGVTLLGGYSFCNTAINDFVVPDSVTRIDEDAFNDCDSLVELKIPFVGQTRDSANDYSAVLGFIFGRDSSGTKQYVKKDSQYLYSNTFLIPSSLKKIIVTDDSTIPFGAFSNLQLDEIILEEKTGVIDNYTFKGINSIDKLMILNPDCVLADDYGSVTLSGIIYGYYNSSIHTFAESRGIQFVTLTMMEKENSTAYIDYNNKFVYGLTTGLDTSEFEKTFVGFDSNLDVTYVCDGPIGTGSIIRFSNKQTGELVDEYITVIFGDINGDGWYDGQDAVTVSMIAGGMLTREQVGEAVWMAADCNHDGVIDQADVELLNQAGVLLSNVDQTKTSDELLETSAEYVEYLNLIDQQTDADSDETPKDNTEENEEPTESSLWNIIVKYFVELVKKFLSVIKVF